MFDADRNRQGGVLNIICCIAPDMSLGRCSARTFCERLYVVLSLCMLTYHACAYMCVCIRFCPVLDALWLKLARITLLSVRGPQKENTLYVLHSVEEMPQRLLPWHQDLTL